MHINLLSIPFFAINNRRDEHQRILGHEISYASFPACVCRYIEFECPGEG